MTAFGQMTFRGRATNALKCSSATVHQVDYEGHQRHNQQQMDQAPSYVKAETEKPENQEDRNDCPKHKFFPYIDIGSGPPVLKPR